MNVGRFIILGISLCISIGGVPVSHGGLIDETFFEELWAPIEHTHFSECGTPYVHSFLFEPPQIHQDVFFIHKYTDNTREGANEHEVEAHVDWALTRRLGILLAAPLVGNQQNDGTHNVDMGDLEIAPRIMWNKKDCFILASNILFTVPTGNEVRDLGAGEVTVTPFTTMWYDLGNWNTLLLNLGPEFGTESGDNAMIYNFSLTHSWLGTSILGDEGRDGHMGEEGHAEHFSPGMKTIYLEMNAETQFDGPENTTIELMPAFSYVLAESAELRFGVLLPVAGTRRFDRQYFTSFTWTY